MNSNSWWMQWAPDTKPPPKECKKDGNAEFVKISFDKSVISLVMIE